MEALEAYALPSSRLANEAAGTTTRFIQDSPHLLSHTGCELQSDSISDTPREIGGFAEISPGPP